MEVRADFQKQKNVRRNVSYLCAGGNKSVPSPEGRVRNGTSKIDSVTTTAAQIPPTNITRRRNVEARPRKKIVNFRDAYTGVGLRRLT